MLIHHWYLKAFIIKSFHKVVFFSFFFKERHNFYFINKIHALLANEKYKFGIRRDIQSFFYCKIYHGIGNRYYPKTMKNFLYSILSVAIINYYNGGTYVALAVTYLPVTPSQCHYDIS